MTDKRITLASDKGAEDGLEVNKPINRHDFLKTIGDVYQSDLFPSDWSPREIEKGSNQILDRRFTSGFWAQIPKICTKQCAYCVDQSCKLTKKPEGKQCPQEIAFLELLMRRYMEDLNVPDTEIGTLSMIRDLCDIEIQLMRKHGIMAREDSILEEPILDAKGAPTSYTRLVEHPVMGQQERLWKRKGDILKTLLATRESKVKAIGELTRQDEMSRQAAAIKELRKQIKLGNVEPVYDDGARDDFVDGPLVGD